MWQRMENSMEHQMEANMLQNEAAYMAASGNNLAAAALNFESKIERMEAFGAAINPFPHHHHHHHHHGGAGMVGAELAAMELAREQQMAMGGAYGVQPVGYYPTPVGYPVGGIAPPMETTVTTVTTNYPGGVAPGVPYGPGYMGPPGYPQAGPGFYRPY